jgi:hypothetical protein
MVAGTVPPTVPAVLEVLMARVSLWKPDSGSKRRIAQIRWRRWEAIHAVVLFLLMTAFSIWIGIWIATHHFD